MQKYHTSGFQIYQFISPDEILRETLNLIPTLTWHENVSNSKTDKLECPKFIEWIESLLPSVKDDLYPNMTKGIKFHVTNCWMNKSSQGQKHHRHSHANAWWSGIYYLSTNKSSGNTKFYVPNPWYKYENENLMILDDNNSIKENVVSIYPEAGKLVIFPSSIQHETSINKDLNERYTISFNVWPTGKLTPDFYTTSINLSSIY